MNPSSWISRSHLVHIDRHPIKQTNITLKCKVPYCDKQLSSCNICVLYFSYGQTFIFLYMAVMIITLSLFRHANKLKQTHHLIVDDCGCMKEFVCGIVNLYKYLKM